MDVTALARAHTEAAIQTLADCLRDPRHKVQAAAILLDRAWGKPSQPLVGDEERPAVIRFEWASAAPPAAADAAATAATAIDAEARPLSLVWQSDC